MRGRAGITATACLPIRALSAIDMVCFYRTAVMATTLSTNIDDKMAQKVRMVAERENRSVSNIVSSALMVFTGLPKDVRDTLLELQSRQDAEGIRRLSRVIMAAVSRLRLETAMERLADEQLFAGLEHTADEIDLLEEATRLTEATRQTKPRP